MKLINQKGATFVLTAILLPVLLAFTGIAVDIGRLYVEKAKLQNLTDAAVLSGLQELKIQVKGDGELVTSIPIGALSVPDYLEQANEGADQYLLKNTGNALGLSSDGVETALYTLKNSDGKYTYYYEVIVGRYYPLYFASIIHPDTIQVRAGSVIKFDRAEEDEDYVNYAYALANWSTMERDTLLRTVSSSGRLKADVEALNNLANFFLNKSKEQISELLGKSDGLSSTPLGHYKEDKVNGEISTTLTTNTTLSTLKQSDLINWMRGDGETKDYDSNKRYLFSDYAIENTKADGNGIKIWVTYKKDPELNKDVASTVRIAINPDDANTGGSAALDVTAKNDL